MHISYCLQSLFELQSRPPFGPIVDTAAGAGGAGGGGGAGHPARIAAVPANETAAMEPRARFIIEATVLQPALVPQPRHPIVGRLGEGLAGRRIVKHAPLPASLSTPTVPPISSTRCFTIASPRPVPPSSRERPASTR